MWGNEMCCAAFMTLKRCVPSLVQLTLLTHQPKAAE